MDFGSNQIIVRSGKGDKDRVMMLRAAAKEDLTRHLAFVREQHRRDVEHGVASLAATHIPSLANGEEPEAT